MTSKPLYSGNSVSFAISGVAPTNGDYFYLLYQPYSLPGGLGAGLYGRPSSPGQDNITFTLNKCDTTDPTIHYGDYLTIGMNNSAGNGYVQCALNTNATCYLVSDRGGCTINYWQTFAIVADNNNSKNGQPVYTDVPILLQEVDTTANNALYLTYIPPSIFGESQITACTYYGCTDLSFNLFSIVASGSTPDSSSVTANQAQESTTSNNWWYWLLIIIGIILLLALIVWSVRVSQY